LAYHAYGGDNPKEALCSTLTIKEGDLIILASDGMADNLFSHEVVRIA
jgi:serine/threonine protein phosphatase PrpC